jgi:hypothetical protein
MNVKEARKLAKKINRKISIKTIGFHDLARDVKRFYSITPSFRSTFSSIEDLDTYKYKELNADELRLFSVDILQDNKGYILLG